MLFLPRYSHSETSPNVIFCSLTILLESLLLGSTFSISLPAIIAWLIAGKLQFKTLSFLNSIMFHAHTFSYFSSIFVWSRCVDIHTVWYMVFTLHRTANVYKSYCSADCYGSINVKLEIDDSFAQTAKGCVNSITNSWTMQMTLGVYGQWIHWWRWWRNGRRVDGMNILMNQRNFHPMKAFILLEVKKLHFYVKTFGFVNISSKIKSCEKLDACSIARANLVQYRSKIVRFHWMPNGIVYASVYFLII